MGEMAVAIRGFVGDMDEYTDRLDQHRDNINQAETLEQIRDTAQKILVELDAMRGENSSLRQDVLTMEKKIRDQEDELQELSRQTSIDPLTLVANRAAFDARLAEEISRSERYKRTFSLIMIDLDHFKNVNDSFGHQAGDRVLRAFGKILDSKTRLSDFVARFGGEEFVVILPDTRLSTAVKVADKVRVYFERTTFHVDKDRLKITASFGVSQLADEDTAETIIKRADRALYLAKLDGRNRTQSENDLEDESEAEEASS